MSIIEHGLGEEMIVWIDGTFGVGKTSVAEALREKYSLRGAVHLDADSVYQAGIRRYSEGGTSAQNNMRFLSDFKQRIEKENSEPNAMVIVTMALTMDECRDNLFLQLSSSVSELIHIILIAEERTVLSRIENDTLARDKHYARINLKPNLKYLNNNFQDAIRIDTEGKNIDEVVEMIVKIIHEYR